MKRFIISVVSCLLIASTVLSGCGGGKKPEPVNSPVITLNVTGTEIETGYVFKYAVPRAECKSTVDKKRLDVVVTAEGPTSDPTPVLDKGYLKPAGLGLYKIHYNATDKDEKQTKAEEVIYTIKFVDDGPVIELRDEAADYQNINNYTSFKVPEIDEIAKITYDLKGWTNSDFTSTKTAEYYALNSETGVTVDVNTENKYDIGTITIHYIITAKTDSTITKTLDFVVQVGDVFLTDAVQRDDAKVETLVEAYEDKNISDKPFIKLSTPFPTENYGWPGVKLMAPNSLFEELNKSEDSTLVLNCYNPTSYWGKYYCSVYDDTDYTGKKGNYGRKYRVAPHSFFTMVVPKNVHSNGSINIIEFSMETAWIWEGEMLPEGEVQSKPTYPDYNKNGFYANELYIVSSQIVDESKYAEKVFENDSIPTFKTYTSQMGTEETDVATLEKYDTPELKGIKVTTKSEPKTDKNDNRNFYIDFLSDPTGKEKIMSEFGKVRLEHRYDTAFTFTVHNLDKENDLKLWAMLGMDGNNVDTQEGTQWLYDLVVPKGESKQIYYTADTRNDYFDFERALECIRLNTDQIGAQFVINDIEIVKYPILTNDIPWDSFEIKEIEGKHTEEALTVGLLKDWNIPTFEEMFTTNFPATGSIKSVTYRNKIAAVGDVVDFTQPIETKGGYYDVVYKAVENTSGDQYTRKVTFTAKGDFTALENPDMNTTAMVGEQYKIPAFDKNFIVDAEHTAVVKAVDYRADEYSDWATTEDYNADTGIIKANLGQYKITYTYSEVGGQSRVADVDYILTVGEGYTIEDWKKLDNEGTTVEYDYENNKVIYSDPSGWCDLRFNNKALFNAFNNASDDTALIIEGKNLSETEVYILIAYKELYSVNGVDPSKDFAFKAKPGAGKEFTIVIPRNVAMIKDGGFRLELADKATIEITDVKIAYESEYRTVKLIEPDQKMVDELVATGDNVISSFPEIGKITMRAKGETGAWLYFRWTTGEFADSTAVYDKEFSNQYTQRKVLAVDITNDNDTDARVSLHFYNEPWMDLYNSMEFMKEHVIPAHSTKTIYASYSMINHQNIKADTAPNSMEMVIPNVDLTYSNFRIVDFGVAK